MYLQPEKQIVTLGYENIIGQYSLDNMMFHISRGILRKVKRRKRGDDEGGERDWLKRWGEGKRV